MRKNFKLLGAVAVAGVVATTGSAFTAGNTVTAGSAGSGTTPIAAYTTSNVQYNADASNPNNLDSVKFTLNKAARYVALQTKSGGTWYRSDDARLGTSTAPVHSCTLTDAATFVWTCDVDNANETVVAADSLTVVATT